MNPFSMVVWIVAIGAVASVLSKFVENRKPNLPSWLTDMNDDAYDDGYKPVSEQRLEQLEARVAVLEKIVTDSSYDLKKEFDKL